MSTFDGAGKGMPAFAPAPARIEESFGTLEFAGGGFADDATTRMLYDELDLQRATQAYLDFYPALSLLGILTGQVHDYGFRGCSDIGIFADFADAAALYLTANTDSVYATLTVDLKAEGPTVIEIPAGMFGSADDAYFRFIVDFGPTGPDQGAGGKYLLVPPATRTRSLMVTSSCAHRRTGCGRWCAPRLSLSGPARMRSSGTGRTSGLIPSPPALAMVST